MRTLQKYGLWILLAAVACTAGAWLVGNLRPVRYTSAAQVDVEAHIVPGMVRTVPNLATEQQIATSGLVLDGAAPVLGMSPAGLAKHLSVTVAAGTNILTISCTMPTPGAARACANATASSYVNFRNEASSSKTVRPHDPLQAALVTSAVLPGKRAGTGIGVLLGLGAVIGLVLGIGTAFVRDRLDDRVRDRDDLERCLDAPVLVAIPDARGRSQHPASVFSDAPLSRGAEAYRYLRIRLDPLISSRDSRGKVLLVASPHAGEGRTTVASNLAGALAHAGVNVLLVDADLRHPSLSEFSQAGAHSGLADLLAGRASLDDVVLPTAVPRLKLLPLGPFTDQTADMFDAARLDRLFSRMTAEADVVIVDSGPVLVVSDPIALTAVSDIVLVVANVRRTRRASVRAAMLEIRAVGPRSVVGVLNREGRSRSNAPTRPGVVAEPESRARLSTLPSRNGAGHPVPEKDSLLDVVRYEDDGDLPMPRQSRT